MKPRQTRAPVRTAEDWEELALQALGEGGVAAVAVEPLARRLQVTKGSFYWHFTDRNELLRRALRRWERVGTDEVIASLEALSDPRESLTVMLRGAFGGERYLLTAVAVVAAAEHPVVAPILRRVARKQLDYVVESFRRLGLRPTEALDRGTLAYSAYLGLLHLLRVAPERFQSKAGRGRYVEQVLQSLLPPRR